jgi:ParB family chromosome partitioning protein
LVRRRLPDALQVAIDQVVEDEGQPRRNWQAADSVQRLAELASSVAEFGILQPLLVREDGRLPDGRWRYRVIAGARRRRAAEMAGLQLLPVIVRGEEPTRIRVLQLLENLQRQDLQPLDEAHAFQELMDIEALTPRRLAERLHVSDQHIRDRLRLLADQVLADAVERRQISATAAREIAKLPDEELLAFRARVLAGERLQTNDIATARARLAAQGVINPRSTRMASREPKPISAAGVNVEILSEVGQAQKGIRGGQTSFDPPAGVAVPDVAARVPAVPAHSTSSDPSSSDLGQMPPHSQQEHDSILGDRIGDATTAPEPGPSGQDPDPFRRPELMGRSIFLRLQEIDTLLQHLSIDQARHAEQGLAWLPVLRSIGASVERLCDALESLARRDVAASLPLEEERQSGPPSPT